MNNPLINAIAAAVLAITWLIACQEILYAAEEPGEGFTAAVLVLLVGLLQVVVHGQARSAHRFPPATFLLAFRAGVGLLAALVAGPLFFGRPALAVFKLDVLGHPVSSTLAFDVAVFLVVAGAMLAAFTRAEVAGGPPEIAPAPPLEGDGA